MSDWNVDPRQFGAPINGNAFTLRWRPYPENPLSVVEFEFIDEEDEAIITGSAHVGGCVNWQTDPNLMYHFCDELDADALAIAFRAMFQIAKGRP